MKNLIQFLKGKKTYLSAFVVAMAGICGWWSGALNETQAIAILGVAGAAAGLGAKSERIAQATLAALQDVRQSQQTGQKVDVVQLMEEIGKQNSRAIDRSASQK